MADLLDDRRGRHDATPPEIGCLVHLEELCIVDTPLRELPPEIGNLRSLNCLSLENVPVATLPREIGGLHSLKCLELTNVPVATLPPEIGSLRELTTLHIRSFRPFEIPPEIGKLQKLEVLCVWGVSHLPASIFDLSELQTLDLECRGAIRLPPEIGRLRKLRCLGIESDQQLLPEPNAESDVLLQGISKADFLRRRKAQHLRIQTEEQLSSSLELPPEIGELVGLESLSVERMRLAGIPREIGMLKGLLVLTLVCDELSALPAELGELQSLAELRVSYNRLTSLPESVSQLKNLALLDVAHNQLTDLPRGVPDLPITELELEGNPLPPQLVAEMGDAARDRFNSQPLGERMSSPVALARAAARWSQTRKELGETLHLKSRVEEWRDQRNRSHTKTLIALAIVLVAAVCAGVGAVLHLVD